MEKKETGNEMEEFIRNMPKVELHVHIEGTMTSDLHIALAKRNNILHTLKHKTAVELERAYNFEDLQSFLDLYYDCCRVLLNQQDFYALTMTYLSHAHTENIRHIECFFDPQAHTTRGVSFDTVVGGIHHALLDAREKYGITSRLIMCLLRDLPAEDGMETLEDAIRHKDKISGIGLDSTELGNPPEKFEKVFDRAKGEGFLTFAHAGEEGPPSYIWGALNKLHVSRIDHGIRCIEDPELLTKLGEEQIPLTVCPLSNVRLRVFENMENHNLKQLLDKGLCVTINSDDPGFFGGSLTQNYLQIYAALKLCLEDIMALNCNSIEASTLSRNEKESLLAQLKSCAATHMCR